MSETGEEKNQANEDNKNLKEKLLNYWIKVSKTLDEDYEEILQLGVGSDSIDIIEALFMIEDARQEQWKAEKQQIECLRNELHAKNQIIEEQRQKLEDLNKNQIPIDIHPDIRSLEIKINELSIALVQSKEDKIVQMEQYQKEIQRLKEQELELRSKVQLLQFESQKKSSFQEEDLRKQSKDYVEEDVSRQSASPTTSKIKLDQSKLLGSQAFKKLTKIEQVQGAGQTTYKFGNK